MKFQYIKPTEEQKELMQQYRDIFDNIYKDIVKNVKDSRGKSLSLTKLEEASFWLNKSITDND